MENKKPVTERVFSSLDSLSRYNEQWRNFGVWLSRTIRILAIILVSLSAIYLLSNHRYITLWNTIPMYWHISDLEIFLLIGGFLSSIFLFFYLLSILGKIIRFVTRLISNGFNKLIVEPIHKLFIWVIQSVTQSRLWKYCYDLGEKVGYKYVLYSALPNLEPTNDRQSITYQTFEELPPEAYSDERLCEDTWQRYVGFGGNLLLLTVSVGTLGLLIPSFILLGVFTRFFSIIASLLPSFLGDPLILFILLITYISPFIILLSWYAFLSGCVTPYKKRQYAWALCQYQFQRKRELEEQAREIDKGIAQQLQVSIEKMVQLYKEESQKTQDAKREFEEATNQLWHLVEQPGMDEKTLKLVYWLVEFSMDKRRKEDTAIRERETREGRVSDIVISFVVGFVISAFFFILSGK